MTLQLLLSAADHNRHAEELFQAIQSGVGIDPPSETVEFTFDDAYQIRRKLVDKLIAAGGTPKGHKIGFTSTAMQEMYGMSGPDFGQLLDTMFVSSEKSIDVSSLCDTRVEPEFAFELGEPLHGPNVDIEQVLAATTRVWAAIEVIDSRVGAMRAAANDSIADNAGAGRVVLGAISLKPNEVDMLNTTIEITVDGETMTGISGDVMGHAAEPVAWLANKLAEIDGLGGTLNAGDIVISGSSTRSLAVQAGSKLHATFGPLGEIKLDFV